MATKKNALFSDPKNGVRLIRCGCGHRDIPENVRKVGRQGTTACLNCYEEVRSIEEDEYRGTHEPYEAYCGER